MSTPTEDRLGGFMSLYTDYVERVVGPIQARTTEILREWTRDQFWQDRNQDGEARAIPTPIQRTYGRIKRAESILDKIGPEALKSPPREETALLEMHDVYGARLVVYVASHLPLVDNVIRSSGQFEMHPSLKPKWYLPDGLRERLGLDGESFEGVARKKSGYASVHYVLRPVGLETNAWIELQVRTMLFEAWGELEHKMIYKPSVSPEFNMTQHLRILADQLMALEEHFDLLYSRVTYLQNIANPEATDFLDDTTLPAICARLELPISQTSVGKLLQILYSHKLMTVGDLEERLHAEGMSAMRAVLKGRNSTLTAFHAISVAVAIGIDAPKEQYRERIKEQLALVQASEVRSKNSKQ